MMQVVEIKDAQSGACARIAVTTGFNCFDFNAQVKGQTVPILFAADGFEAGEQPPSHSGIPILFPYPNRIRAGRYSWNGSEYELPESLVAYDGAGNAIHGFCLDVPWRVTEQTANSVTGEYQISLDTPDRLPLWPTDGRISICYSVKGSCLRADIEVSNPTDEPLPWGFGTHAYFRLPLLDSSGSEDCTIYAPVANKWELKDCLPTGRLLPPSDSEQLSTEPSFGGLKLDDVYTSVQPEDGIVTCRMRDNKSGIQVVQRSDDSFREIVAFTPPWASAVCLEPYTCTTDAINLQQQGIDAGWRVLKSGETWKGWIEIAVTDLAAS